CSRRHGRWRTPVNGGAQYSKACEGATPPWVQIPPPPPLTCKNTGIGSRQAGASCALVSFIGLSYELHTVPPPGSAAALVARPDTRATLDDPEHQHARRPTLRPSRPRR